ncbi:NifU family protein [Bergeyella cardium]|uniref:NifU family protein n=1 Tax=Bergeyella cardium TaxID=1585976 RepID=A0A6P1QY43_9FLAO|nr:NifU family protein [Bergeyella cardium]QHN65923.1 NifU family protein [Bergeyella cardium]WHE33527.1 NifU family protein [Bergeyella cardium]WHF60177.1 NifU family protein [Bergeyella cardium]
MRKEKDLEEHEETVTRVLEALESIRPFLHKDGGDIELIDVVDDKVYVRLLGNCNGCPVSFSTMKLGVETTIKQMAPEINEVLSVEG